ncbi:MAG: DUF1275 domain-containing protein [Chitinophagaceae bacterium]|nr:DUF1275 domain-containing protein [Bacteroidota bacterium]MCC6257236.1 DUF1275 domain-containing protein [Chitinophagaceae bacterium]MCW5916126.1 DUF1275 domain-containing protein [Ferruginibacter sp.]
MFRHTGKTRTLKHNLRIASLLSLVAGIVNVVGFFSVNRLTTNVTGHFAYLIDEVYRLNFLNALAFFLYIFFFFLGSFFSGFLVEFISRKSERNIYVIPAFIEALILLVIVMVEAGMEQNNPDFIACSLLFAMGLQNSLVTSISNAIVRTTHLTGLFTDLGIELSQLFFYRTPEQKKKLNASIRLRLTIITCFFLGGILGGILFAKMQIRALVVPACMLLLGIVYDHLKFRVLLLKKKLTSAN